MYVPKKYVMELQQSGLEILSLNEKVDFISALREALLHKLIEHCGKPGDGRSGDSQIRFLGPHSQLHFLWSRLTHTVLLAPFPGVSLVISSFRAGLETRPPK